ncbi:MAG: phage holin family protein [Candidatus Spechtbacterales bacterium]|nr:phage holin family protein [Candidatus Spechtbacterales bacterium]
MFIVKIALKIAANAAAVYIASLFVNGVSIQAGELNNAESLGILALIGFVLWFGNYIIRPLLKVLTFPLILVTFGLFNVVINMGILWAVDIILPQMEIAGFIPLAWTTAIVTLINSLLFFL